MDWRETTNILYSKIKPVSGTIHSMINELCKTDLQFSSFWISFDTGGFEYYDPFYEDITSEAMDVDLIRVAKQYNLWEIRDLENRHFENTENTFSGFFSNSLDIVPKHLKFGNIKSNRIEFEMEYSLTNSDSYGMMNGTKEEHLRNSGHLKIELTIADLVLFGRKENGRLSLVKNLSSSIYDIESMELASNRSNDSRLIEYTIKYKNIKGGTNKKKWWSLN